MSCTNQKIREYSLVRDEKKEGSPKAGGFERCSKTIKQQLVSAALWDIVNKKYTKPKA